MAWTDFLTFKSTKLGEYIEEVKEAKELQDNQKKFQEGYLSKEKERELQLEGLLADGKETTDKNAEAGKATGAYSGTTQEKFWQFFVADGYTKQAVAGMMGNVEQESSFLPDAIEGTDSNPGEGHGLCQWSFGRKAALMAYAKKKNTGWEDVQTQLEYLKSEMDGGEGKNFTGGIAQFKKITSVDTATKQFCLKFERALESATNWTVRYAAGNKYYNQFKDAKFETGAGGSGKLTNPTKGGTVTSKYGMRLHPIKKIQKMHKGIDIAPKSDILAAAAGTVTISAFDAGYGNYVVIDHGDIGGKNIKTLYAHLEKGVKVAAGDKVTQGEKIAVMGTTGGSTGIHLHFEVKEKDANVDPQNYVKY